MCLWFVACGCACWICVALAVSFNSVVVDAYLRGLLHVYLVICVL